MPRIDPLSLLRCLSVLLGPNGGIKSKEEVIRLANLMTKFSKKLVSKCIYIQILKSTTPELLSLFMAAGGWNLIHMWLTDGILAKNWALIQELLELLLLCPVDIERLKSNNCPKLIKGLSKEGSHQGVRTLASRLVEQWLKMVKGEAMPVVAGQTTGLSSSIHTSIPQNSVVQSLQPNASITPVASQNIDSENAVTVQSSDFPVSQSFPTTLFTQDQQISPVQKSQTQISAMTLDKPQTVSTSVSPSVYKITIRDGKQVLTQVQTDAANINPLSVNSLSTDINGDVTEYALPTEDETDNPVEKSEATIQRISTDQKSTVGDMLKDATSEVKDNNKDTIETELVKSKDNINEKDSSSVSSRSNSDKENRDKKDDKKSVSSTSSSSSDKKSSSQSTSSKSSSKHSSSSSKHSSSSHRSSSHRSSSKSSSSSKDKSSRDKEKDKHHSSSSSKSSSSKSKTERDKEKEKLKKDQAEKDKATLEKLQNQTFSTKMGKIPKKKADDEKPGDSPSRKSSTDSKDSFKENKDKVDPKKVTIPEKKNISISIENRKNSQDSRPKTVKTFNSKFRSTGLEEEIKPPPPRGAKKSASVSDKKVLPPKIPLKRPSPLRETSSIADKKAKLALDPPTTPPSEEKKGGIKLIPAKPKLMLLQESDMFMDALTASTKSKEPRKRKRRTSITKDGPPDPKKCADNGAANDQAGSSPVTSPATSPSHTANSGKDTDDKSLLALKPTFKFYQDTLETDEEKEDKAKGEEAKDEKDIDVEDIKKEKKDDDENDDEERSRTPTPEEDFDDVKGPNSPDDPAAAVSEALKKEEQATLENRPIGGVLKSVLVLQKRKGPKKSLKWKSDLESIRYFELDETERVNVTKTFTDMKQMEKQNEREAFQMARKLSSEDVMEEKTIWKPLIPIDLPPPLVEPGKESREKDIQYAREKGILQALYFNRSMIPDSPAEPDEERHPIYMEPKIIPLDDLTGNKDSEKDFTGVPWPEPKPQLPAPSTIMQNSYFQSFRPNQHPHQPGMMSAVVGQPSVTGMAQQMNSIPAVAPDLTSGMPVASGATGGGGGGWRTGDGKIVVPDPAIAAPMQGMSANYSQGMDSPGIGSMGPPGMMGGPQMYNQDGYMMGPDDMGYNNFQGPPPGPGMYGPPGPGGPPYQGPRGPPMHGNRGRGGPGPGWFRGGPPRGMPWRGGWRGNGKQPPVCRQFSKNGYCRIGDKCQFLHPGVNCPPF